MAELFYMGGPLFMGILTLLLLILLVLTVVFILSISSGKAAGVAGFSHRLTYLKSLGLFTMITTLYGIFVYMLSILIWFLLDLWYHKKTES